MGFFGIGQSPQTLQTSSPQVRLTDDGREKLRKMEPTGWEFDVLTEIKKQEPCTSEEVARGLSRPENKVKVIINQVIARKWARVI